MELVIKINLDNAAFQRGNHEVGRLLADLAEKLALTRHQLKVGDSRNILDINGNKVGMAEVIPDDDLVVVLGDEPDDAAR